MFLCLVVKCGVAYKASLAKQFSQGARFIYIHPRKLHLLLLYYFHGNTYVSCIFHVLVLPHFQLASNCSP